MGGGAIFKTARPSPAVPCARAEQVVQFQLPDGSYFSEERSLFTEKQAAEYRTFLQSKTTSDDYARRKLRILESVSRARFVATICRRKKDLESLLGHEVSTTKAITKIVKEHEERKKPSWAKAVAPVRFSRLAGEMHSASRGETGDGALATVRADTREVKMRVDALDAKVGELGAKMESQELLLLEVLSRLPEPAVARQSCPGAIDPPTPRNTRVNDVSSAIRESELEQFESAESISKSLFDA